MQKFGTAASPTDSPEKPATAAAPAAAAVERPSVTFAVSNEGDDGNDNDDKKSSSGDNAKKTRPLSSVPEIREPAVDAAAADAEKKNEEEAAKAEAKEESQEAAVADGEEKDVSIIDFTDPESRLRA